MKSLVEILEGGFYKSTGAKQASKTILAEQEFLNDIITKCVDAVRGYYQLNYDVIGTMTNSLIIHIKHEFVIHGDRVDLIITPSDSNRYFQRSWTWSWGYRDKNKEGIKYREDSRDIIDRIYTFCRSNNGKVTFEFTENLI